MSLGEFPTYTVCTYIVGNATSGNCSFGNETNNEIPHNEMIKVMR
jgi:hypothetical protein